MSSHNVQEATTVEDVESYAPKICAELDNKKTKHRSHMIEVIGMINKQHIDILIDSGAIHSYINPNIFERFQLSRIKHNHS